MKKVFFSNPLYIFFVTLHLEIKKQSMDDKSVFDRFFREWYLEMVYFAYFFIKDMETCKDIASDAFEYLWRNYEKVEEGSAKSYLFSFVRTRCVDHFRKQNSQKVYADFVRQIANRLTETTSADKETRYEKIQEGMELLTEYNLSIFKSCYIENKSYKEVAAELGVSVSAIHKNIVKALKTIRKYVAAAGDQ